jgi:hypothetical protein
MSVGSETLSYKGCRHAVGVSNLNEDNPKQAVVETTAIVERVVTRGDYRRCTSSRHIGDHQMDWKTAIDG